MVAVTACGPIGAGEGVVEIVRPLERLVAFAEENGCVGSGAEVVASVAIERVKLGVAVLAKLSCAMRVLLN